MPLPKLALNGSSQWSHNQPTCAGDAQLIGALAADIGGGAPAAPTARRLLTLFEADMSKDSLDDAKLIVSELVNNSVEHGGAGPGSVVRMTIHVSAGIVKVEISDSGPGFVPPASLTFDDLEATSGRGLRILNALTDRWGVETAGGTRVWFEMAATRMH